MRPLHMKKKAIAAACAGLALLAASTGRAQVPEAQLKAAYIYNFAMFTTWPPDPALQKLPFVVCANPEAAMWTALQGYNGKPVNGRAWILSELARPKGGRCDIAILARGADRPAALASALAAGTLVVRDGAGHGSAAITLLDDDEHVRFDVDTQEAARNGLRFSSRLLRLARNVQ
jgi:hypothetical protein